MRRDLHYGKDEMVPPILYLREGYNWNSNDVEAKWLHQLQTNSKD
jgi:hypothetical protein